MKILLIEDDKLLSASLIKVLKKNGYIVDLASDGQAGFDLAAKIEYDLLLLDVQLPKLDGISLCRQLRSQGFQKPILLLTVHDSDVDVVAGFDVGADDYISKPCAPDVLLARIRHWLRRSGALLPASTQSSISALSWGRLSLNPQAGRVMVDGQEVSFTTTEYKLLELFLHNPDRIFSRSVILDRLWRLDDAPSDRAIVTYIKDVRKKLKASGLTEDIIETVYGMGYRLKPAPKVPQADGTEKSYISNQLPHSQGRVAIDTFLEKFQGVFNEQVAVLEQSKNALLAGKLESDLQQAARQESHKLAGSLSSFGYPQASKIARSLEHLLIENPPFPSETLTRFANLVAALQQELTKEPSGLTQAKSIPSTALPVTSVQTNRVLVIDDDITLTERLKAEADAWGMRVSVVSNPAEARSHLSRNPSDVVLLDLSFPEVEEDGLTLLQEMNRQFPQLPVIVFTGRDSLLDRLAVVRAGARQFLHKSATPEQVFTAIACVLPKPQAAEAKVLIVDDDPGMLALLSDMLMPWGLKVTTLSHPQEFWNVLVATDPNIVLLDLEMPQINGLELCQVVRQDPRWEDIPLLVVTAYTDADFLQQAFAAGADDFITKPVLGPELVTRVISRIDRTRLYKK